jgi:hypothetical protein
MCRNIRTLFNFEPPATEDEIRASALQFVRKLSGFNVPSKANEDAFNDAVEEVADAARRLLQSLSTTAAPRDREVEAAKARERSRLRFSMGGAGASCPGRSAAPLGDALQTRDRSKFKAEALPSDRASRDSASRSDRTSRRDASV